jgi:putative hemolysin
MSLSKIRIRHLVEAKVKNAKLVEKLVESPNKLLSTILVGNTACNIALSAIATSFAISLFKGTNNGVAISTIIVTIVVLIFAEIIPKTLAVKYSEQYSLMIPKAVYGIIIILTPLVWVITKITGIFVGGKVNTNNRLITEEELKTIVDVSQEEGVLEVNEKEMIYNVFKFGDQQIRDVMVPRTDVVSIGSDFKIEDVLNIVREDQYSRLPVYSDNIDNIIGILNVKDLLCLSKEEKEKFNVSSLMREPYYTYEFKNLSELFTEMKKDKIHMAIVLDEYGGTAGIVTVEDIIEEIVGDIEDEYDETAEDITVVKEDEYVVDGSTKIEDVNEMIGTALKSEDFDSIGGFIIGEIGKIPAQGEIVEIDNEDIKFVVEELENNRVKKIRIFT